MTSPEQPLEEPTETPTSPPTSEGFSDGRFILLLISAFALLPGWLPPIRSELDEEVPMIPLPALIISMLASCGVAVAVSKRSARRWLIWLALVILTIAIMIAEWKFGCDMKDLIDPSGRPRL